MYGYMQCGLSCTYKRLKNKMWFSLEQAEAILSLDHSYFKSYFPVASYFDVDDAPKILREDTALEHQAMVWLWLLSCEILQSL